jgi:hypothetical protein
MDDLVRQLLNEIENGRIEEATRTSQRLGSRCSDPAVCNRETLTALKKASTLAIIQRSHIQRRLRSLAASRLYRPPIAMARNTWQIDG